MMSCSKVFSLVVSGRSQWLDVGWNKLRRNCTAKYGADSGVSIAETSLGACHYCLPAVGESDDYRLVQGGQQKHKGGDGKFQNDCVSWNGVE